jgi:hypothetical protein
MYDYEFLSMANSRISLRLFYLLQNNFTLSEK